jgi:hypothetical protein
MRACVKCGVERDRISYDDPCYHDWGDSISTVASPDAPTVTNEKGGKQSYIPVRFDLIDPKAMFEMAKVLHEGAEKYGENNWRQIDVNDHLNHALMHINAYLAGDTSDDHLSHLLCRATFALGVALANKPEAYNVETHLLTQHFIKDFNRQPSEGVKYSRLDRPFAGVWQYSNGRWVILLNEAELR